MTYKSTTLGATVLYAFSLGFGLLWWVIAWEQGALGYTSSIGRSTFLFGLAAFQILGFGVPVLLLRQSTRRSPQSPDYILLGITAGVLLGNLFWCVTPVLGAPLILVVTIVGFVRLYIMRKS